MTTDCRGRSPRRNGIGRASRRWSSPPNRSTHHEDNSRCSGAFVAAGATQAQVKERPIPRMVKKDGRYALFVDGAPYLMLGAQAHNSSAWPAHASESVAGNRVPERQHGGDTGLLGAVRTAAGPVRLHGGRHAPRQARAQHRLRLVLLWFGTWKNGSQHYMPEWMKLDPEPLPAHGRQERARRGLAIARTRRPRSRRTRPRSRLSCGISRRSTRSAPSSWCRWRTSPAPGAASAIIPRPRRSSSKLPCRPTFSPPCR